jgi:hypothetical protein
VIFSSIYGTDHSFLGTHMLTCGALQESNQAFLQKSNKC